MAGAKSGRVDARFAPADQPAVPSLAESVLLSPVLVSVPPGPLRMTWAGG